MTFQLKHFLLSSFFLIYSFFGFSQCCSPGNPVGGDANQGVSKKNSLRVIGFVKNSISNDYYEGTRKSQTSSFVERGTFNFSGVTLAYGLLKRFTVETEIGYFLSKKQEYNTTYGKKELRGTGFSDLAFIGKFKLYSRPESQFEFTGGGGYKIPIGPHQQRNENGILLPIDIQPSSGASGFIGTLFFYKGFSEKKLRFFLTSRVQINPYDVVFDEIIPTKYYHFGNFYTTSFFSSYGLSHRLNFVLQTRYEYRTQDFYKFRGDQNYRIYESSGGQKIFVVPQVLFEISQGLNASAMFDFPVYQYYNQKQLATAYAGTITISKVFDFSHPEKKVLENENREN